MGRRLRVQHVNSCKVADANTDWDVCLIKSNDSAVVAANKHAGISTSELVLRREHRIGGFRWGMSPVKALHASA